MTSLELCRHTWNIVMDGCVFFREERSEKQGGGVAFHVREQLECIKLYSGTDEQVDSLWVRVKGQANMGDTCGYLSEAT